MTRSSNQGEMPQDLPMILQWVWDALHQATLSAKHPYHNGMLATLGAEGAVDNRVVVLREVNAQQRWLDCNTDVRAEKVQQIQQHPSVAWLFWNPKAKVQIRIQGQAHIHIDDDIAKHRWEQSTLSSRRCYLAPHAPSSPIDEPDGNLPKEVVGRIPTEQEAAAGWDNFSAVRTQITRIDWLYLYHAGHQRAQFSWDAEGNFSQGWINP